MAVMVKKWLKLHPGSRLNGRVVTKVVGRIGRDPGGGLVCGKHYLRLRPNQSGTWTCPISACKTVIETEAPGK